MENANSTCTIENQEQISFDWKLLQGLADWSSDRGFANSDVRTVWERDSVKDKRKTDMASIGAQTNCASSVEDLMQRRVPHGWSAAEEPWEMSTHNRNTWVPQTSVFLAAQHISHFFLFIKGKVDIIK